MTLKLVMMISGTGSTFTNLLDHIADGRLDAEVTALISTTSSSPALEAARQSKVNVHVLDWKTLGAQKASEKVWSIAEGSDLVVLGGFLKLLKINPRWEGRIINIHPSLLPKYGGKGFYKHHVHKAVLENNETVTGCTVHVVDPIYDNGTILAQEQVPVESADTVETLSQRVVSAERRLYPQIIQEIASGKRPLPLKSH